MLLCDEYLMPGSLDEAFAMMARHAGAHRVVAGATDFLPWAREGRAGDVHQPVVIDISRVRELCGHTVQDGRVRLGANVTFADFLADHALRAQLPVMPFVSVWFADDQIREQATLAGNIVNASPAADGTPAMIALDATLVLQSEKSGARTVKLTDFVTGPGETVLADGELITAIECDALPGYGAAFEKVGHRRSLVISTVCVACLVKLDAAAESFQDVRLGLAAVGPVPSRLTDIEDFLKGKPADAATMAEAARMPLDRVQSRTRQDYRRDVLGSFIERALLDAVADFGVGVSRKEVRHA
jgi:carbon-monoxide dehydrogenase medium subunit/xanthine dehydrogenase FAD-binding subunit